MIGQLAGSPEPLDIDPGVDDLSGVAIAGDCLLLGNDEGHDVYVCRGKPGGAGWTQTDRFRLSKKKDETDIEALCFAGGYLYVAGSHSLRRKKLRAGESLEKNRKRFSKVDRQPSRSRIYRIPFAPETSAFGSPEYIDLSKRLRKDELLGRFTEIPSKENGVDIEGIAMHRGGLLLGFRGPVLRHNLVPVMALDFDNPKDYALRFVDLNGHGIRDMVSLGDSLLLLSGPVGDAPGPFRLWWWDGRCQMTASDVRPGRVERLGNLRLPDGAKAEGLALLKAHGEQLDLLLVCDGLLQGRAQRLSVALPRHRIE